MIGERENENVTFCMTWVIQTNAMCISVHVRGLLTWLLCSSTYLRGQNVPVDATTRHEHEEKRRKYLEHQARHTIRI